MGWRNNVGRRLVLHKLTTVIFATSFLTQCALADVPYQFSNGEVADANQVNANFNALNDSVSELSEITTNAFESLESELEQQSSTVESIQQRVGALESSSSTVSVPEYLASVSYQRSAATIGQLLELQDPEGKLRRYVVTKFPFAEFSSYSTYSMTFPLELRESNDNGQSLQSPSLTSTNLFGRPFQCSGLQLSISGFPACLQLSEYRTLSGQDWRAYENSTDFFSVRQTVTVSLQIIVGETLVGWGTTISDLEFAVQSDGVSDYGFSTDPEFDNENFNWDFTQAFATELMDREPVEFWINQIDQLIDYIVIE